MAKAGATGGGVAVMRRYESERDDALIRDPEAGTVAGPEAYDWYWSLSDETRMLMTSMVAVRTRWIDDAARRAIISGAEQVVVVGSGADTRYARAVYTPTTRVFELDFPRVLDRMSEYVNASHYRYQRIVVPCDLTRDGLGELTANPNFSPKKRTVWILEGVTGYLSDLECHAILTEAFQLSGAHSEILATFVGASRMAFGPTSRRSTQHQYVTDRPAKVLEDCGWRSCQYACGEIALDLYGRRELGEYDYWLCWGFAELIE